VESVTDHDVGNVICQGVAMENATFHEAEAVMESVTFHEVVVAMESVIVHGVVVVMVNVIVHQEEVLVSVIDAFLQEKRLISTYLINTIQRSQSNILTWFEYIWQAWAQIHKYLYLAVF